MPPNDTIRAVEWKDHHLILLEQSKLPHAEHYLPIYSAEDTAEAIRNMGRRGAPGMVSLPVMDCSWQGAGF